MLARAKYSGLSTAMPSSATNGLGSFIPHPLTGGADGQDCSAATVRSQRRI